MARKADVEHLWDGRVVGRWFEALRFMWVAVYYGCAMMWAVIRMKLDKVIRVR